VHEISAVINHIAHYIYVSIKSMEGEREIDLQAKVYQVWPQYQGHT